MRFLLNNYFLIEISAKILWRQNVEVDKYIENILNKLSNRSSNTGVIYLKETKLIDTQIKLLTDNIENALNRVIKLRERKKVKSKIAKTVQSLVSEYGTNDTFAAELLVPDNISTKYHGFTLEQVAASENMLPELVKLKFRLS